MKFSEAVGCTAGRSDKILGPVAPIIPKRVNNVKMEAWGRFAVSECSNVLPLAALFHSDNLVEKME